MPAPFAHTSQTSRWAAQPPLKFSILPSRPAGLSIKAMLPVPSAPRIEERS